MEAWAKEQEAITLQRMLEDEVRRVRLESGELTLKNTALEEEIAALRAKMKQMVEESKAGYASGRASDTAPHAHAQPRSSPRSSLSSRYEPPPVDEEKMTLEQLKARRAAEELEEARQRARQYEEDTAKLRAQLEKLLAEQVTFTHTHTHTHTHD